MKTKREILDYLILRRMTLYCIAFNIRDLLEKEKDIDKINN